MKLESLKNWVNNQKKKQIRGKVIKSSMTFSENKPNSINSETGVSSFEINKYEILPACRGKKQTQSKPNSNPIPERPKMNTNIYNTMIYNNETFFPALKTNPIQTQYKPKTSLSSTCAFLISAGASGTFLHLWVTGKIDFLDGCDILLEKIYAKSQFNLFGRLIS